MRMENAMSHAYATKVKALHAAGDHEAAYKMRDIRKANHDKRKALKSVENLAEWRKVHDPESLKVTP